MKKCIIRVIHMSCLLLLGGCQTNTTSSTWFPPTPYPMNAPRVTLAQTVQNALIRSEDPVIAQVHVETNQNRVILSGYVKKIRQSDMAEQIAAQIAGAQNVQNQIIVRQ